MKPAPTDLYQLASTKQLPAVQFMDAPTLSWLKSNRPDFAPSSGPARLTARADAFLERLDIPESWQLNPDMVNSLHGTRHGLRCAIYGALLASGLGLSEDEVILAAATCAIHDLRRQDDRADVGHGARTAAWLASNADAIAKALDLDLSAAGLAAMTAAIGLHDLPYADFRDGDMTRYESARQLTDIVKTADALDRWRLPKTKWWPDLTLMVLLPSDDLLRLAFDLCVESEAAAVSGADNRTAVRSAWQELRTT